LRDTSYFKEDLPIILDLDMSKVEIVNSQELMTWSGFQGEGLILDIYFLSEKTTDNFLLKTNKQLSPKKERSDWQQFGWEQTPMDSSIMNYLTEYCLTYCMDEPEINAYIDEIKKTLNRCNIYFSFYYRPNKENPCNIQFFVFDTENKILYAMDMQD